MSDLQLKRPVKKLFRKLKIYFIFYKEENTCLISLIMKIIIDNLILNFKLTSNFYVVRKRMHTKMLLETAFMWEAPAIRIEKIKEERLRGGGVMHFALFMQ